MESIEKWENDIDHSEAIEIGEKKFFKIIKLESQKLRRNTIIKS